MYFEFDLCVNSALELLSRSRREHRATCFTNRRRYRSRRAPFLTIHYSYFLKTTELHAVASTGVLRIHASWPYGDKQVSSANCERMNTNVILAFLYVNLCILFQKYFTLSAAQVSEARLFQCYPTHVYRLGGANACNFLATKYNGEFEQRGYIYWCTVHMNLLL